MLSQERVSGLEKPGWQVRVKQLQKRKVDENMRDDFETEDYEVGYKKPPESGQFKKGVSGNPSGRPKKPPEIGSEVMRELESPLMINENGKRKVIKKREGVAKQLVNKSLSGHLPSTRMVLALQQQELEKAAEQQRLAYRTVDDLTDEELMEIARGGKRIRLLKESTPDDEDS
jgi:hypothetical protein